ncbi:AAA family ATPase [Nocardia sp. CA-120079]|uniref:AAA family ATPase n=1 Tax=Nocardia sp. CA-120079 TaxID=3239974 RepID=UPI003D9567AF
MSTAERSANRRPTASELALTSDLDRIAASAKEGVTFICGFPASGKSTAARYLAQRTDAIILDKDTFAPDLEESVMAELSGNPHDRDSDVYMRVVNPHIYTALVTEALSVGQRTPVVVDAPFIGHVRAAARQKLSLAEYFKSIAPVSPPPVRTVWISADPDLIRERMARRGAPRDACKLADWYTYRAEVLDSGIEASAEAVVDYVVRNA